jgi:hypothetical protein
MPMVNGKKYPYTPEGIKAAKKANAKHEKTEGKTERYVEYAPKKRVPKKTAKRVAKKSTMVRKKGM